MRPQFAPELIPDLVPFTPKTAYSHRDFVMTSLASGFAAARLRPQVRQRSLVVVGTTQRVAISPLPLPRARCYDCNPLPRGRTPP